MPFTNHKLKLQKGDTIYIFTDGYTDQFGDKFDKKIKKIKILSQKYKTVL